MRDFDLTSIVDAHKGDMSFMFRNSRALIKNIVAEGARDCARDWLCHIRRARLMACRGKNGQTIRFWQETEAEWTAEFQRAYKLYRTNWRAS